MWFVITTAIISFGVGVVAPLMNVVFHEGHVHANEGEIGIMSAIAIVIGSRLIDSGDFTTPFLIMATALLVSTIIYWRVFRPVELARTGPSEPSLADFEAVPTED